MNGLLDLWMIGFKFKENLKQKSSHPLDGGYMERFLIETGKITRLNPASLPVKFIGYLPEDRTRHKITHPTVNFGYTLSSTATEHKHIVDGMEFSGIPPYFMFCKPDVVYETPAPAVCEIFYYS